jgi:hypothetical protein
VYPVPLPDTFDTWQDWAKEFTEIINGPSRWFRAKKPYFLH